MPTSKEKKENESLLTIISPSTDMLQLLPIEIRSSIYKFVSEAFTVHVTRKLGDDQPIAYKRLLSPPGKKHIASWRKLNVVNPVWSISNPVWSISNHLSLRTGFKIPDPTYVDIIDTTYSSPMDCGQSYTYARVDE